MAGHSKWANIQHRKGAQDKKRGKIFTKLIREITIAARMGGGEVSANPRLRLAVDKALTANMTRDTIERAIKRGAGGLEGENVEEIIYEGYGPAGVAVMVECLSDNRNRTVSEVRHAFTKCGGNLGTDGSVAYIFSKKGQLLYPPGVAEDQLLEVALEAGAEDIKNYDDGSAEVLCAPEEFDTVRDALVKAGLESVQAEVILVAATQVTLDQEAAEKMTRLIDMLEDLDDVQNVYSNADM